MFGQTVMQSNLPSQPTVDKVLAAKRDALRQQEQAQEYEKDIELLERCLDEENSKINVLKKQLAKTCDVDGSNIVYRNHLKFLSTQNLQKDIEDKIKDYLKDHITNFKPPNDKTQRLIEEIKSQNAQIIKGTLEKAFKIENTSAK
jgi:hypothetical protein